MQHLDEGTIHAWLDGELPSAEREALEAHIAECAPCAAALAEARGFVAASTRILTALDSVPGGVLPAASTGSGTARPAVRRRFVASRAWMAAAAVLVLSTVTVIAIRPGGDPAQLRVAAATRDQKEQAASTTPS
jgi:anti-sigma factor RsiW